MAVVVFYMLLCAVRYSMPGIGAKERNRILLMRVLVGLAGAATSYLFMYVVYLAKGHLVRDPMFAQKIALCIFLGFVVVSEFFARRKIKRLNIFPPNRPMPWTY